MAENSKIEWTDDTWNPITGCTLVSEGCRNCYAARLAATRHRHLPSRAGLAKLNADGVAKFTGEVRFNEKALYEPLRRSTGRRIFVCAHGDLFHEAVPDEWIDRVFAVMALCPQHQFQVLTKRPERMRDYMAGIVAEFHAGADDLNERFGEHCVQLSGDPCAAGWFEDDVNWPLRNVWLGVSVEDQKTADERIPHLLATPAAVRFISAEPLLGPVDIRKAKAAQNSWDEVLDIDWVIVGGESGRRARPMHPDWARSLRDQCAAAGVAFLFTQWGEWVTAIDREAQDPDWRADYKNRLADRGQYRWLNLAGGQGFHGERFHVMQRVGKRAAGRLLDGVEHNGFPEVR